MISCSWYVVFHKRELYLHDKSFNSMHSMSDNALAVYIGAFVRHHRMEQNKTQDELASAAGISRSNPSLLERGETVTVSTLIQVLRVLDQLSVLSAFEVRETISPLALVKLQKGKRLRARGKSKKDQNIEETDW
jgi:transcriptional regulator with XRE-family HTH domain